MHIQRGAWAEINLDAIAHNVQMAKANLKPTTKLCAVVKADAYGHGAVRVAQEAARNGADFFAVALLQEGVKLREAGIETPILVLGSMLPEVAEICVRYDISHAVFDEERLYALNAAALKLHTKAKIHIKIDTGMHVSVCMCVMPAGLPSWQRPCPVSILRACSVTLRLPTPMISSMLPISLNAFRRRCA